LARDANGTGDLPATADGKFFLAGETPLCSADNNVCYPDIACVEAEDVNATTVRYRCPLDLAYYTTETISAVYWNTRVALTDSANATTSAATANEEVNKLVAGTFENVAFGILALGFETNISNEEAVTHYNNGNVVLDFDLIAGSDLGCSTLGTIPATGVKFDGSINQGFGTASFTLSKTATVDWADLNAAVRTNDASTSAHADTSYWSIRIPAAGVSGTCQATITAVAVENQ
jgi:hypothetical protein